MTRPNNNPCDLAGGRPGPAARNRPAVGHVCILAAAVLLCLMPPSAGLCEPTTASRPASAPASAPTSAPAARVALTREEQLYLLDARQARLANAPGLSNAWSEQTHFSKPFGQLSSRCHPAGYQAATDQADCYNASP